MSSLVIARYSSSIVRSITRFLFVEEMFLPGSIGESSSVRLVGEYLPVRSACEGALSFLRLFFGRDGSSPVRSIMGFRFVEERYSCQFSEA